MDKPAPLIVLCEDEHGMVYDRDATDAEVQAHPAAAAAVRERDEAWALLEALWGYYYDLGTPLESLFNQTEKAWDEDDKVRLKRIARDLDARIALIVKKNEER